MGKLETFLLFESVKPRSFPVRPGLFIVDCRLAVINPQRFARPDGSSERRLNSDAGAC